MKYVKMLGLAAAAVAALMALVGSGTASATVLCKTQPNGLGNCPSGWGFSGEVHAVSTSKPTLTTTFKTVECNESTLTVPVTEGTSSGTETPNGGVKALTFEPAASCNCTVAVIQKGELEIHVIGDGGSGTLTSNGATVTVSCITIFGTVHCNYVTNNKDIGNMVGGTTPTITITTEVQRETTNTLCDEEAIWHASYKVTTPDSLWVATATG